MPGPARYSFSIPGSGARVVHPKEVTAKGTGGTVSVRRRWYRAERGQTRTGAGGRCAVDLPYKQKAVATGACSAPAVTAEHPCS